jgi:endonuclease/exonuclease/phosphatase family metal-dependent hydrolase
MKKTLSFFFILLFALSAFSQGNGKIAIMSFNLRYSNGQDSLNHWNYRKEAVVKMINSTAPDVIGFQEALYDQVQYLDKNCSQYLRVGVGRDDGVKEGEFAAIYFLKKRFTVVDSGNFWLSETPDVPSLGWDAACKRIVTWVHLEDTLLNNEFYIFNTHFDHIGTIARKESALLLLKKIGELAYCFENNIFITGDFNTGSEDPIFLPLKKHFKSARDVAPVTDKSATFNGFGKPEEPAMVIDHIWFTKPVPVEFKIMNGNFGVPYISDHYPVLGIFKY